LPCTSFVFSICPGNEAITHFLKVEEIEPGYRFSYRNTATCYIKISQLTEAISYCNKAIEQNPKDGESYFYRGFAYIQVGEKAKGCKNLNKALELGYSLAKSEIAKHCK
jgi:tetratricopeptide (TPR) repeat protein